MAIVALIFGGILAGYIQTSRRAEWTGYSLAAEALAIQQLEQARSAVWDNALGKNEITNLNLIGWIVDEYRVATPERLRNALDARGHDGAVNARSADSSRGKDH